MITQDFRHFEGRLHIAPTPDYIAQVDGQQLLGVYLSGAYVFGTAGRTVQEVLEVWRRMRSHKANAVVGVGQTPPAHAGGELPATQTSCTNVDA